MGSGDGGVVAYTLGRVGVGVNGREMGAVDLGGMGAISSIYRSEQSLRRTESMAFLTRSDVIRPLLARFLISAVFVEAEHIQAMLSTSKGYWFVRWL